MDLPTTQTHQMPMEQMIFDDGSGQLDRNGHIDPDLLLVDPELFALLMPPEANSEDNMNMNMDLPTNQAHLHPNSEETMTMDIPRPERYQMPLEQMIFDDGAGQLDHSGHIDPDLLLVNPELFALLTHFFSNISSWEVCYIMLHL